MQRKFFSCLMICAALVLLSGSALAQQKFVAHLDPQQEVPATASSGTGVCFVTLNNTETSISVSCTYTGLTTNLIADHIHGNAAPGVNTGILFNFAQTGGTSGSFTAGPFAITPAQVASMRAHLFYINLHTNMFPGGEIRGQVKQAFTVFDLDGDGRTDPVVFRQSNNTFFTQLSLSNSIQVNTFGPATGDIFLNNTADFDGDGRGDPLLIELVGTTAYWTILQTGTNTIRNVQWGDFSAATSDTLAISDYDGDGIQDIAVYRRLTGVWYIIQSTGGTRAESFGAAVGTGSQGDFPSVGDYDGDGKADLTVVRVESGNRVWYIRQSSDGFVRRVVWGASATDGVFFFAPFDFDGDGKQDIMVNRAIAGERTFLILRSSDGQAAQVTWGRTTAPADTALFGDYDGDGKTDFVARRNEGGVLVWYIRLSSTGATRVVNWGVAGDQRGSEF